MKNFFDTSYLTNSLAQKTVRGGAAVGVARILNLILSIGSTAILARLLLPEDFGLVAMVMAVLGFVLVFREMGLSMATVQKKDITHEQVSNLFWINCGFGFVAVLVIFSAAPLIGKFYNDARLPPIAAALSLVAFFSCLTVQHQALARRHMKFWLVQAAGLGGNFLGIAVAVILAFKGFGYWALVWQNIINHVAACMILWMFIPWRPGLPRRGTGVKDMITFGVYISGSRLAREARSLVDKILIGSLAGPSTLGLYTKAFSLLMLPVNQLNYPVSSVSFPALSRLQDDRERFQSVYYQGIALLACITMPVITFLVIVAEDLIPIFLGPGWDGTVVLFQALAPAAYVQALDLTKGWATIPLGRARRIMVCNTIDSVFTIAAIFVGIYWGALGVAVALSICAIVKFIPLNLYAFHDSPITLPDLFSKSLKLPILFCLISGILTLTFKSAYNFDNHVTSFVVQGLIFSFTYVSFPLVIPGCSNLFYPARRSLELVFKKTTH